MLVAANDKLNASLDTITDPNLARSVVTEMREVLHRLDLVQSLLFTQASVQIAAAVQQVQAANRDLQSSLQSIKDTVSLVNGITSFLTVVDKAIDLAKVL